MIVVALFVLAAISNVVIHAMFMLDAYADYEECITSKLELGFTLFMIFFTFCMFMVGLIGFFLL
jgi:hypothetical protein